MYMHNLPDFPALENLFKVAGYVLDVDLSNSVVIEKDGEFTEYDDLPEHLQKALDKFAEDNNLN